ncbi:23S rRNA (guanosine(2251)-2'-O)-methyltransferase RlmB [Candidatus Wolfebacteria bacterium]|nr:MAG: 23S rRNA (guanosine(2251)-2'-O)-methyltransferase RlmB [Candidatus Wolfebacteria bacterium]
MKKDIKHKILVYGVNPVAELVNSGATNITRIYMQDSSDKPILQQIRSYAQKHSIGVNSVSNKYIKNLVGDVAHQGVVALLRSFEYVEFNKWVESLDMSTNPAVLLLDEVQDPHNVGAMIRSAAAFGLSGVILPSHRQSPVTNAVFKSSAGTVMHIPVIKIGNVNQMLKKLKEMGFWIVGIHQDGHTKISEQKFDSPTVLIVGNEGYGIRQKTLEMCDFTVQIPMSSEIESLNAAVSTGIACYEWSRQQ